MITVTWSQGDLISANAEKLPFHVLTSEQNPIEVSEIIAENGNNIFIGAKDESPLSNNYIVLRNRKTNKVRNSKFHKLIDYHCLRSQHEQLRWYKTANFLMQPYRSPPIKEETVATPDDQESKREAMLNLNKTMGSKKIKKRVMVAEKINVMTDNIEEKLKIAIKSEFSKYYRADSKVKVS